MSNKVAIKKVGVHTEVYEGETLIGFVRLSHSTGKWYFTFKGHRFSRFEGKTKKEVLNRVRFYLSDC